MKKSMSLASLGFYTAPAIHTSVSCVYGLCRKSRQFGFWTHWERVSSIITGERLALCAVIHYRDVSPRFIKMDKDQYFEIGILYFIEMTPLPMSQTYLYSVH